jgi:hypothetical protein
LSISYEPVLAQHTIAYNVGYGEVIVGGIEKRRAQRVNWKRTIPLLLFMLVSIRPLSAQTEQPEPLWTAWLYNQFTGRALLVADDGQILRDFALPNYEAVRRLPLIGVDPITIAVSHDGTLLAYVTTHDGTNQLQVFDTLTQTTLVLYEFSSELNSFLNSELTRFVFSEDDSTLAFGFSREDGTWELLVLDTTTGDIISSLTSASPTLLLPESTPQAPKLPVVLLHRGDDVVLSFYRVNNDAPPFYTGVYIWGVGSDGILPTLSFRVSPYDYLTLTGEVLRSAFNPDLSNSSDFPERPNTLVVYEPNNVTETTFFHDERYNFGIYGALFVQNGERIVTSGATSTNGDLSFDILLLERDGTIVDVQPSVCLNRRGLADGLVVMCESFKGTSLRYIDTEDDTLDDAVVIWESDLDADDGTSLIWAGDNRPVNNGPFMEWAQITEPVYVGPE